MSGLSKRIGIYIAEILSHLPKVQNSSRSRSSGPQTSLFFQIVSYEYSALWSKILQNPEARTRGHLVDTNSLHPRIYMMEYGG